MRRSTLAIVVGVALVACGGGAASTAIDDTLPAPRAPASAPPAATWTICPPETTLAGGACVGNGYVACAGDARLLDDGGCALAARPPAADAGEPHVHVHTAKRRAKDDDDERDARDRADAGPATFSTGIRACDQMLEAFSRCVSARAGGTLRATEQQLQRQRSAAERTRNEAQCRAMMQAVHNVPCP